MKGLNLSKFKKMTSDGKSTTLKSPEGHKIVIAHHAISPAMRKQLDSIPKKYAEGGEAEDSNLSRDAKDAYETIFGAPEKEEQSGIDFASRYNAPAVSSQPAADAKLSISPEERAGLDAVRTSEGPLQSDSAPPQAPALDAQEPPATLAPQPTRAPAEVPTDQAAPAEAAVPAQEMQPPPEAQTQTYQKSLSDYKQAHQQQFAQDDAAFAHDLENGHVPPETYQDLYAKRDTLGKVGMLFGLLMSGIGSGMTGQENSVLKGMNQEIKNDLEAQMKSKENAQNFIKLNQQQQMNQANIKQMEKTGQLTTAQAKQAEVLANSQAYALANMQANRAALHNQAAMVAKMPEGPQKEQAKAALAMMGSAVTNENANIGDIAASKMALMSTMGGGGNATALRVAGMDKLADDVERKTIPGIGKAQIPVPQETRDSLAAQKQYDEKAREYVDFAKKHAANWANMNLADRQRVSNQGAAMAANLQSLYRNKIKGGVYKKGEQEFIEQIIPDQPAKWSSSINAIPKVEQTIRDNRNDIKNTASSVGLDYSGPKHPQGEIKEGAASTSKSGKPIVFTNGKWHYK